MGIEIINKNNKQIESEEKLKLPLINWGEDIDEEFEKSMKKRKETTKNILEVSEEARGNDFILLIECLRWEFPNFKVWNDAGKIKIEFPRELVKSIPTPESYRRVRQKFNENNLYLPSKEIQMKRLIKQRQYKRHFSVND